MGFFDFLKSKKKEYSEEELQFAADAKRFEEEVIALVPRFLSMPGAEVNMTAHHKETGEVLPFAIGFPVQFNPWRAVKSVADRRGIIYGLLDEQLGHQMKVWQIIERLNDDRYAEKALQYAIKNSREEDKVKADYWAAVAKTNFILTNYGDAERNCRKALTLDSTSIRAKRIFADVLHETNRHTEAHELYKEILTEKMARLEQQELPLQKLLGFDGDILNSPIYAIGWLQNDENVTEEIWEWANAEFYYSPHFRSQYAYELIKRKEPLKALAKLHVLCDEMPWFKEAAFNTLNLINQLGMTGMEDKKQKLEKLIAQNNWTHEGMHSTTIKV